MNLDLDQLIGDWPNPEDQVAARLVQGVDGRDVLQLRVDMGVLQMFLEGRPDGQRYRGLPTVLDYVRHELQAHGKVDRPAWRELQREMTQFNYRRIGLAAVAETALRDSDLELGRLHLRRALRDIDHCLIVVRTMEEDREEGPGANAGMIPLLIFNRARLLARLLEIDGRYEEAIEEATAGAEALDAVLERFELDDEAAEGAGIAFLRELADRIRTERKVKQTLRERLDEALAKEDFEAAARLRDTLSRRRKTWSGNPYFGPDGLRAGEAAEGGESDDDEDDAATW